MPALRDHRMPGRRLIRNHPGRPKEVAKGAETMNTIFNQRSQAKSA